MNCCTLCIIHKNITANKTHKLHYLAIHRSCYLVSQEISWHFSRIFTHVKSILIRKLELYLMDITLFSFSNTFDRVEHDTDRIWKFLRYSLVCEYLSRPPLPTPFSLLAYIWQLAIHILKYFSNTKYLEKHSKKTTYSKRSTFYWFS